MIRTLQCLPLEDYVDLGKSNIKLDNIDLFTSYILPGPEFVFIIDEHHNNEAVKALLDEFQSKYPQEDLCLTTTGIAISRYKALKEF